MGRVPIQVEQFYIEICCIYHFYFYFILSLDISLYLYCCPFLQSETEATPIERTLSL